ncbi:hypothetical protein Pint_15152 [Pistacia integerrima]|uniref:Uncharacterized protein n=1 Tax=Pistacia integerrima TaxID=434235 RepID=A0ACC0ZGC8_9ROSI|nr:hypothetical protein Pint_15152 [Pistacia integerrima]
MIMAGFKNFVMFVVLHELMAIAMAIDTAWYYGRATFYGDMKGGKTMQGARGYGDLFKQGYGLKTVNHIDSIPSQITEEEDCISSESAKR